MEIYLGTDDDKIRFPVVPSSIGVNRSNNIDTESVIKLGEVPIFNGTSLKTIELTSFFPNQEYSFCDYTGFMKPYEFSDKIQKWMYEGKPLRIIVTDTPTNMQCLIQQFDTVEQDGTRDLYFTLNFFSCQSERKKSLVHHGLCRKHNAHFCGGIGKSALHPYGIGFAKGRVCGKFN